MFCSAWGERNAGDYQRVQPVVARSLDLPDTTCSLLARVAAGETGNIAVRDLMDLQNQGCICLTDNGWKLTVLGRQSLDRWLATRPS